VPGSRDVHGKEKLYSLTDYNKHKNAANKSGQMLSAIHFKETWVVEEMVSPF
jgi:hypothetical protein